MDLYRTDYKAWSEEINNVKYMKNKQKNIKMTSKISIKQNSKD